MASIVPVRIFDHERALIHESVSNLNHLRIKVVGLVWDTACKIYQIQGGVSGIWLKNRWEP